MSATPAFMGMRPQACPRGAHRSLLRALLASAALLLITAGAALAAPSDVLADYDADGVIDERHSIADLRGALTELQGTSIYGSFADAVQAELNQRIGGVSPPSRPASPDEPAAGSDEEAPGGGAGSELGAPGGGAKTARDGSSPAPEAQQGSPSEPSGLERVPLEAPRRGTGRGSSAEGDSGDPDTASALTADEELPQPPTVEAGESVPLVFVAFSIAAAVLLLAGVGSAIYRRTGSRRA